MTSTSRSANGASRRRPRRRRRAPEWKGRSRSTGLELCKTCCATRACSCAAPSCTSRIHAPGAGRDRRSGGHLVPRRCGVGWKLVESQARIGDCLREKLLAAGWTVVNRTALPVVCFTHPRLDGDDELLRRVCPAVQERGRVWISSVLLAGQVPALRACITSFRTEEAALDVLVAEIALAAEPGER